MKVRPSPQNKLETRQQGGEPSDHQEPEILSTASLARVTTIAVWLMAERGSLDRGFFIAELQLISHS